MMGLQEKTFGLGQTKVLLLCLFALVVVKTVKSQDIELLKLFGHLPRDYINKRVYVDKRAYPQPTEATVNHTTTIGDAEKTATPLDEGNTVHSIPTERMADLVMDQANTIHSSKTGKHGRVKRNADSPQSLTNGDIERMVSEAAEQALHNRPNEVSTLEEIEKGLNKVDTGEPLDTHYSDSNSLARGTPLSSSSEMEDAKGGENDALNSMEEQLLNIEQPIATPVREKFPDLLGYKKGITLRDLDDNELEKRRIARFTFRKSPSPSYKRQARGRAWVGPRMQSERLFWPEEDVNFEKMKKPILQKVYDPSLKGKKIKKSKTSMGKADIKEKSGTNYFLWVTLPSMIGIVSIIIIVCIYSDPEGKRYDVPPDLANLKEGEQAVVSDKEVVDDNDDTIVEEELVSSKPQECTETP